MNKKLCFVIALLLSNSVQAIPLKADFLFLGAMMDWTGIGYGGVGFSVAVNSVTLASGSANVNPGGAWNGAWNTSGLLSGITIKTSPTNPIGGASPWSIFDRSFSVNFDLDVNQGAMLQIELSSGDLRMYSDFANDSWFSRIGWWSPFANDPRSLGLTMLSVTLADGTPLQDAGFQFEFIPENTLLSTFSGTNNGGYVTKDANPPDRAWIHNPGGVVLGVAQASADSLINVGVSPDPNPLVIDISSASIGPKDSSKPNIRLIRLNSPPPLAVPEPGSLALISLGMAGVAFVRRRKAAC